MINRIVDGWSVAQRLGLIEVRMREMEEWFAQHPDDGTSDWGHRAAIHHEVKETWVDARLDFLEMADEIAGTLWKLNEIPASELNLRLLEETAVDYRDRGRTERSYRTQWSTWLHVNPEPCPF